MGTFFAIYVLLKFYKAKIPYFKPQMFSSDRYYHLIEVFLPSRVKIDYKLCFKGEKNHRLYKFF